MINWIKVNTQYILPKHLISRLVGKLAAAEAVFVTQFLIKLFIKAFKSVALFLWRARRVHHNGAQNGSH